MSQKKAISLRTKKLGVLLRDARLAAGKSMKDCGQVIGVSGSSISSIERGKKAPSLPELEILVYYLGIPLEHFWGEEIKSDEPHPAEELKTEEHLAMRDRVIGSLLRQARNDVGLTQKDLSEQSGVSTSRIRAYESGERAIPLPELESLSKALGLDIQEFSDNQGPVGQWLVQQRAISQFLTLPQDLMEFISKPVNRPYLEVAQRLSRMSTDQLRAVAEGLLEITL